jgi:hypothetical protein
MWWREQLQDKLFKVSWQTTFLVQILLGMDVNHSRGTPVYYK